MKARHAIAILLGAVLLALFLCGDASAQSQEARVTGALQPEFRVDWFGAAPSSVQGAAGGVLALTNYVRLSAVGGAGPALDGTGAALRGDVIVRFTLDPFRQSRWGVALGGGVSVRHDPGRGTRPLLALTMDVDPPGSGAWQPSVQVGLGGGIRAGVGLRRTRTMRR